MNDLNIEKLSINGNELVYRTGEAPKVDQAKGIKASGDIETPKRFFEAYKGRWKDMNKYLSVNYNKGTVNLYVNPDSTLEETIISGGFQLHWLINTFAINDESRTFAKAHLIRLLKSYRYFFVIEQNLKLVQALEELDLHIEKKVKDHDNRRGAYHLEIKQTCNSSLPKSIEIKFNPFIGEEESEIGFELELHFEIESDMPVFYFQSPAITEYIESQKAQRINKAIQVFVDAPLIPVVHT